MKNTKNDTACEPRTPMETASFEGIGVSPFFAARLGERNILKPTAIQQKVIPPVLAGGTVIFRSATGTGKTFAYLLPILQRLLENSEKDAAQPRYSGPELLICAPTYELCSQIKTEIEFLLEAGQVIKTALLIGSGSLNHQIDSLKKSRPRVAVGNPGRLLVLMKMRKLKLGALRFLVLDEADRMTAPESSEETAGLLGFIAREMTDRNITCAACSATVTGKIGETLGPLFAGASIIESEEQEILRDRIEHWAIFSESRRKIQTLRSLLGAIKTKKSGFKALIFAGRNDQAGKILSILQYHHISAALLSGGMGKRERKEAVDSFRAGKISVLVASDLAARGLDIPGVSHVIALDVPADKEAYIHRAGRTARAGKRGIMVSIGDESEMRRLATLEKKLGIMVRPRELYEGVVREPEL